jgi:hypothetical protein
MTQQTLFQPPTTAGDLAPLTRFKHEDQEYTLTSYHLPREGSFSVLCRAEDGSELKLADDVVVEVAS